MFNLLVKPVHLVVLLVMTCSLPMTSFAAKQSRACGFPLGGGEADPIEQLFRIPYKKVNADVLKHSFERRGFIEAPVDYERPNGPKIKIFYRLLPAIGSTADDSSKPVLVVINGGPGLPSSRYRSLDFNYTDPKALEKDKFRYLAKDYRVLLVDQRGTDGFSAPLDIRNPALDPYIVAKYFSADSHARDYAAAVDAVTAKHEDFFIIAQSYGGLVGMKYLTTPELRQPTGIAFTSAALPGGNVKTFSIERAKAQLDLNRQLLAAVPSIKEKLLALRAHFLSHGFDAGMVHRLWRYLGRGAPSQWPREIEAMVDSLLTKDKVGLQQFVDSEADFVSVLNYILSSSVLTPGFTDRSLAKMVMKEVVFESWMLNEAPVLLSTGGQNPEETRIVETLDENPPAALKYGPHENILQALAKVPTLFTIAKDDANIAYPFQIRAVKQFEVPGKTNTEILTGGHQAIFLEEGSGVFKRWAASALEHSDAQKKQGIEAALNEISLLDEAIENLKQQSYEHVRSSATAMIQSELNEEAGSLNGLLDELSAPIGTSGLQVLHAKIEALKTKFNHTQDLFSAAKAAQELAPSSKQLETQSIEKILSIDTLQDIRQANVDTIYSIPGGEMPIVKVLFTEKVIKDLGNLRVTDAVRKDLLKALANGLASTRFQRGVKILKLFDGTRFAEVKTIGGESGEFRIFGCFENGKVTLHFLGTDMKGESDPQRDKLRKLCK